MLTTEKALVEIQKRIERNEKDLAKFQKSFAEDPVFAFEWAEGAMAAAAVVRVYKGAIRALTEERVTAPSLRVPPATVESLVEYYTGQILRRMSSGTTSSSRTSTIMRTEEISAQASLVELLTEKF